MRDSKPFLHAFIFLSPMLHMFICLRYLLKENSVFILKTDLREDKHYLADHPGLVPVTTAQVCVCSFPTNACCALFTS